MVFADTSFWIAVSSHRDQYHSAAIEWARHLMLRKDVVVTTKVVPWEWLNAMAGPSTRAAAAEGYRRTHRDSQIQVVAIEENLIESAVDLYRTREDKHWSLTDCLSFVVMTQRQIGEALPSTTIFNRRASEPCFGNRRPLADTEVGPCVPLKLLG